MQGWVYILSGGNGRHYIGSTRDVERRLEEHRRGSCHSSKRLGGSVELAAAIACPTMDEARALERRLKAMKNPRAAMAFIAARSSPD